ncbi:MAG: phosphoenolpyruvate carboxylase, partial [Betaproteobacteria bacterium]|nr:phosphoenolpyruvate carboxylase [Betaproteobacteria bacterium]
SPVLTAHPTEVQRQSILQAERDIAAQLERRDHADASERQRIELVLKARITQLWQTRMLRTQKLTVADEIENALSYYHTTFLRELPQLYAQWEQALDDAYPRGGGWQLAPFFRMGHWIGGDRDGNPFVTAATLRHALQRQAATALRFYLDEVHALGAELSMSTQLVRASDALKALADASPDRSPHRADEPYRRALIGAYARLAATLRTLTGETSLRHEVGHAEPYAHAGELLAELDTVEQSLHTHHAASIAQLRVAPLRRAVQVFGFHLATLDLRQSSDVHEATVAELLRHAGLCADYAALDEAARRQVLLQALADPRALRVRQAGYSALCTGELEVFEAARDALARYGRDAIRQTIISHTEEVSDLLEVLLL